MINIGLFLIVVGVSIILLMGISLSAGIDEFIPYMLFWLMYIISIATVLNILITIYYYYIMKDKKGPKGPMGLRGDMGDMGKSGTCEIGCRNKICEQSIKNKIVEILNKKEKEEGNNTTDFTNEDMRNLYIKEKIKTICQSQEFQQLVPYKGANNLINYLSTIWVKIVEKIYDAGGINYFKTIGAENDWDWVEENPWNEFKKYDIYYWGLSKDYRPQIIDKCDNTKLKGTHDGSFYPEHRHLNKEIDIMQDNYKSPSKKDSKYSILQFINTPSNINLKTSKDGINSYTSAFSELNGNKIKMYNAFTFKPTNEIIQKYEAGQQSSSPPPHKLKPMSYLIGHHKNDGSCVNMNTHGSIYYTTCDPYNPQQIFNMKFDDRNSSKLKKFKLINQKTNNEVGINNNNRIVNKFKMGDLFKLN
jgi:hypothetical protein